MKQKSLGLKLLELRQSRKQSQKQLCEYLGIGRSTYSYYETGRRIPDLEMLMKIATFYRISLDELVSFSAQQEKSEEEVCKDQDILICHHLKSKHIPMDFVLELSKADFDFLKKYKELTEENKAELQYLMRYKLKKQETIL